MKILLVSAAEFETDACYSALSEAGALVDRVTIGVGALNAAKSAPSLAAQAAGKNVIFIGTCGVFGGFNQPRIHLIRRVHWLPTGERLGFAYTVKDTAPPVDLTAALPPFLDLPTADAICSPCISTTDNLDLNKWSLQEPTVENLELYSVAGECQNSGDTFTALLTTTNSIGPDAHQQWRENFQAAANITANFVAESLREQSWIGRSNPQKPF